VSAPAEQPALCAAPQCHEPLPAPSGRGRPRLYCSPKCRTSTSSQGGALRVEVDCQGDQSAGRPSGRVWLVRMRRGTAEVIVANELGRPSADHLAGQIAELLSPTRRAPGAAME
jgi:hypothetical protein